MESNKRKRIENKEACDILEDSHTLLQWIEDGGDVNVRNKDNFGLLDLACNSERAPEKIAILLANGADANVTIPFFGFRMPMVVRCHTADQRSLRLLIGMGMDVHAVYEGCGSNVIHYEAGNEDPSNLQFFIDQKVDINRQRSDGRTPLHMACEFGCVEAVKILLANKADTTITMNVTWPHDTKLTACQLAQYNFSRDCEPKEKTALETIVKLLGGSVESETKDNQ